MKRLLTLCLLLIVTFSLSAGASISIGRVQPASKAMKYWHFDDCAPPCWAGITPNSTTWDEAVDRVTRLFSDFDTEPPSSRNQLWTKNSGLTIIELSKFGVNAELVSYIYLSNDSLSEEMPSFGELVAIFGTPTCMAVGTGYAGLYYEDLSSQVILRFGADDLSETKSIDVIGIGSKDNLSCQDLGASAVPWRGFRNAELYLADMTSLK